MIVFVGPGERYHGNGSTYPLETWEWDGTSWTRRVQPGPIFRYGFSLAFDEARGATVLFGGHYSSQSFRETWEWDGTNWQLRDSHGPSGNLTVFNPIKDKVFLLSADGGLWMWDGSAWTTIAAVGGPTDAQGIVFDSARGLLLVFTRDNIWTWDGETWAETMWALPPDSDPRCAAFDKQRGATIAFDPAGNTLALDENGWTLLAGHSNRAYYARYHSRLAFDDRRFTIVSYDYMAYQAVLFELGASQWRAVATTEPGPRWLQAMTYDS